MISYWKVFLVLGVHSSNVSCEISPITFYILNYVSIIANFVLYKIAYFSPGLKVIVLDIFSLFKDIKIIFIF